MRDCGYCHFFGMEFGIKESTRLNRPNERERKRNVKSEKKKIIPIIVCWYLFHVHNCKHEHIPEQMEKNTNAWLTMKKTAAANEQSNT